MKHIIVLAAIMLAAGGALLYWFFLADRPSDRMTEDFIRRWLTNDNGMLATYLQDGEVEDEDEVKGREALSETLGLWMTYAYEREDEILFEHSYQILIRSFLAEDGFVYWKLSEQGEIEVSANAFIDDLRLAEILMKAGSVWKVEKYQETARYILSYLEGHNIYAGIFTDFYERKENDVSDTITLSYIDAAALRYLREDGMVASEPAEATMKVLFQAPAPDGFYPKAYHIKNQRYLYDEQVNMVDQALTALHQAEMGVVSQEFLQFIQTEMRERELVHGIYDLQSREPLVDYESPAIYALLVMYCLEIGETRLADALYDRMTTFRIERPSSKYYGGYSIHQEDTHIFDNVLPMLAELRMKQKS
ncbi:glycosyl hydrolase family 8 [Salibacterium aidingense]|uniref:glycosyl hydrolase family 8 n=1 Tax=Salibacterium aidingense TaxID=384933 RepID=UPI003BDC5C2F